MTDAKNLPVYRNKHQILDALAHNQVIIVESPTGSGKTTQIPLILKEAGYTGNGIIGITQPRRIATLSVCSYIRKQIECEKLSPDYCAYKMRFYDTTSSETKIKILTDGMLLQELKTDPTLSRYSVIMVDEAHERSLNIDFILGLLKQICAVRNDIKVIISSATINTSVFSAFFGKAPVISIQGKAYEVDVLYRPIDFSRDVSEIYSGIAEIINELLVDFKSGGYRDNQDTLVFLPGELDIKMTMQEIYNSCDWKHLQIYPLYGRLNKEEQEQVFDDTLPGKMKVVLATNIAETSLTIDGIKSVIDSGLAKINYYNQFDFTSSLVTRRISRSSAKQRTGRAGRTAPGVCYRLYSEEEFNQWQEFTQEEILRTDLSEVVLRMSDLAIYNYEDFPFITRPHAKAIKSGEQTRKIIGAIDNERHLTDTGTVMVKYPLLPRLSRALYEAVRNDIEMIKPVTVCVSFLSCKTPFTLPPGEEDAARNAHRRFSTEYGDFIGYQFLYRKYCELADMKQKEKFCSENYLDVQCMEEIVHVVNQLIEITNEMGVFVPDVTVSNSPSFAERCMKCLAAGLVQYVCIHRKKNTYRTLNTNEIYIHPGSAWFRNPPPYILAGEIVLTTKMYARTVSPMKQSWIDSIKPGLTHQLSDLVKKSEKTGEKDVKNKAHTKTGTVASVNSEKTVRVFGFTFTVMRDTGKNKRPIVIIPAEEVTALARAYRHSSRHPKNFSCAVRLRNRYAMYGEGLHELAAISPHVAFTDTNTVENPCRTIFNSENISKIIPHLSDIMKLAPLAKYRDRLGFIELISSADNVLFHVAKDFNEALNNSAYTLLSLSDSTGIREFNKVYNRLLKMLD
ncbi:MAG: ATP-dependent RNA helicase [Sphaerochaetaceae bacterium]|nr:ATP-dependent RNA helicase [Sphaerochaetaceae bacterium]